MDLFSPVAPRNFRVDLKGTSFDSVIGIPEAKREIQQYLEFLKDSGKFTRLGARMPRGCLLTGEPGTGKTLLAKAVAGEAKVPFFSCNGSDFVEIYGGSGPKRVRELFEEARKSMPSVVFIDEIDAIGSRHANRGGGPGGVSSEENRTVNQLLSELDGLAHGNTDRIVVFAATNLKDSIDPALLREGRFDRKVDIEMPDKGARKELFQFYLGRVTLSPECKGEEVATQLADLTPGLSPATIATIVNEAALGASLKGLPAVTPKCLRDAIEDVTIGKQLSRSRVGVDGTTRTACHECGHAMTAWLLPLSQQRRGEVLKVSVRPRGSVLGYTQRKGAEAYEYDTDVKLFHEVCVLLGGRVAETLMYDAQISTGAVDDLQKATKVCLNHVLTFGFDKGVGRLSHSPDEIGRGQAFVSFSEQSQNVAEQKANELLHKAQEITLSLLRPRKKELQAITEELVKKKELDASEIESILGPQKV